MWEFDTTNDPLITKGIKMTYSSGYGGSGKSKEPHSQAARVTDAMWGPFWKKKGIQITWEGS